MTENDAAWPQLLDDLRRYVRRRVSDTHAADDIVQDTLAKLAAQLHAGDFAIDPEDCAFCAYRTVCRVVALVEDEDDK